MQNKSSFHLIFLLNFHLIFHFIFLENFTVKDFRMNPDDNIEQRSSSIHIPRIKSKTKQPESSLDEVKSLIDEIDLEPNCKDV